MMGMSALRVRARRGERGAVLAEFLMIVPLILICGLAAVEIGGAYRSRLTISGSIRTSVRVAANAGHDGGADWQSISALRASLTGIPLGKVNRVVIYKAAANGSPTDLSCLSAGAVATGGVTGACNVYSSAQIASATAADFTAPASASCVGKYDAQWCPLSRLAQEESIGVWISVRHDYMTQFLPSHVVLTDQVVMQIEPEVS